VNFLSWLRVSGAIGKVTLTEILRDKILYNVLMITVLLFVMGILASRLTFIRPERVVLDFGQSAVSLSCAMISVFLGAGLVGREFERRTIHVALSHPISRGQFVLGKYVGISVVLLLNWALISVSYLGLVALLQPKGETIWHLSWFVALLLSLLQSWVLAAIAICASTFTTTSLSVILSIGVYLVGHNISELLAVIGKMDESPARVLFTRLANLLPNLEQFQLGLQVTYEAAVQAKLVVWSLSYGALLIGFFLLLSSYLINQKEV
jgi:Cu-processing system permease protein